MRANNLKRLWWCCILRDRTLSLGLRRNLQITEPYRVPDPSDFEDQIGRSLIYDTRTQRRLTSIFIHMIELSTVLTKLLPSMFCPGDELQNSEFTNSSEPTELTEHIEALQEWYSVTQKNFPLNREDEFQHQSVIIQTNLMYIYYQ